MDTVCICLRNQCTCNSNDLLLSVFVLDLQMQHKSQDVILLVKDRKQ